MSNLSKRKTSTRILWRKGSREWRCAVLRKHIRRSHADQSIARLGIFGLWLKFCICGFFDAGNNSAVCSSVGRGVVYGHERHVVPVVIQLCVLVWGRKSLEVLVGCLPLTYYIAACWAVGLQGLECIRPAGEFSGCRSTSTRCVSARFLRAARQSKGLSENFTSVPNHLLHIQSKN